MKLPFDDDLLRQLAVRFAELYPESIHVAAAGLLERPDREIWGFAKAGNFVSVGAGSDSSELATTIGPPSKVVWLRRWTHPTRDAERALRREVIPVTEFAADPKSGVLVPDRD